MPFKNFVLPIVSCFLLAVPTGLHSQVEISEKLPSLGSQSTIIPLAAEYNFGRAWLAWFRGQATVAEDPLITDYFEYLTYHLKAYADMDAYDIEVVAVDSSALNAFAVPGGVLGINTGILLQAETEDQLASIVAHELGHISQRHFARSNSQTNLSAVAGLLAGIVAIAAGAPDAGIAAITAGQAASLENQLRYSRQHEREADRTGIQLLAKAGFEPTAAPEMFKIMLNNARLNRGKHFTFLSTHPITESRIADTRNRSENLIAAEVEKPSSDYPYIQAIIQANNFKLAREAITHFSAIDTPDSAAKVGLTQAYLNSYQPEHALATLAPLLKEQPNRILFNILKARALLAKGDTKQAMELMQTQYQYYPTSYPVMLTFAKALELNRQFSAAKSILEKLSYRRPSDPVVWEQLAEVAGLAGDIMQVHFARAEYFRYVGQYGLAERQLLFVLKEENATNADIARAEQLMADIAEWQEQLDI